MYAKVSEVFNPASFIAYFLHKDIFIRLKNSINTRVLTGYGTFKNLVVIRFIGEHQVGFSSLKVTIKSRQFFSNTLKNVWLG